MLKRTASGWSEPQPLRSYINTEGGMTTQPNVVHRNGKEYLFFTSDRKGGRGEDDIYSFELPELQIAVNGTLRDMSTKKAIVDAEILLIGSDGSRQSTRSKADGAYSFKLNQYVDYM